MKTLQELFEMAVRGLSSQGWSASTNKYGDCVYRGEGGRKCAIGHCIPDNKYREHFENNSVTAPSVLNAIEANDSDANALREMQKIHDMATSPTAMLAWFINFAETHGLTWPADVPQEIAR